MPTAANSAKRRRYFWQLGIGVVLLLGLAFPAAIHSQSAIHSLYNRPVDWVPDSVPVKAAYLKFSKRFEVSDLLLISWPGATLNSDTVPAATTLLRGLCDPGLPAGEQSADDETDENPPNRNPQPQVSSRGDDEFAADRWRREYQILVDQHPWIPEFYESIAENCGTPHPLNWVRNGTETLDRLTARPASLPDRVARRRLMGTLVGPDQKMTCLFVSVDIIGDRNRRSLLPAMRAAIGRLVDLPTGDVAMVGGPLDGSVIDNESIRSIGIFSPISVGIAAVLCLLCLRSIPLTTVILVTAVIGQGLVLAMVYYSGRDMNAVLIVLPPLVFVLTVSAGIHLSNYFLDIAREFPAMAPEIAASQAMRAGMMPCILATATTVVGLSSLLLVRLEPVRIFGAVASIGISLTLPILFLVLPGAMILTRGVRRRHAAAKRELHTDAKSSGPTAQQPASTAGENWAAAVQRFVRGRLARPWPAIVTFGLIAGMSAIGLTHLQSSVNVPRMFLPESDIRQQYAWFEQHVGPTATGDVVLKYAATEQVDSLQRLDETIEIQKAIMQLDGVGGTLSAATFVPPVPRTRRLSAAAARSVITGLLEDPNSSIGRLKYISRDHDAEYWRITVRLPQSLDANFKPRIEAIREVAEATAATFRSPPEVTLTGHVVIIETSQEILLNDLFISFVTAFGVIAVVMILMLRNIAGGLLAMIPNLFPTVTLFGVMGWISQPLDIGSVMSASVALGIAVDDTVHLLSRYGSRRARGLGQIRAAHGALSQCGWAMFQTTLVCGVSLLAYYFSDFVPTSRFSLLMFGLLSSALLGVLILLPSMMASTLGQFLSRPIGSDPQAAVYADRKKSPPPADTRRL